MNKRARLLEGLAALRQHRTKLARGRAAKRNRPLIERADRAIAEIEARMPPVAEPASKSRLRRLAAEVHDLRAAEDSWASFGAGGCSVAIRIPSDIALSPETRAALSHACLSLEADRQRAKEENQCNS